MKESTNSTQALETWNCIPSEMVTSWMKKAEEYGFNALLPSIEENGINIVNRTLGNGIIGAKRSFSSGRIAYD